MERKFYIGRLTAEKGCMTIGRDDRKWRMSEIDTSSLPNQVGASRTTLVASLRS